jgi:hypothetical protein
MPWDWWKPILERTQQWREAAAAVLPLRSSWILLWLIADVKWYRSSRAKASSLVLYPMSNNSHCVLSSSTPKQPMLDSTTTTQQSQNQAKEANTIATLFSVRLDDCDNSHCASSCRVQNFGSFEWEWLLVAVCATTARACVRACVHLGNVCSATTNAKPTKNYRLFGFWKRDNFS